MKFLNQKLTKLLSEITQAYKLKPDGITPLPKDIICGPLLGYLDLDSREKLATMPQFAQLSGYKDASQQLKMLEATVISNIENNDLNTLIKTMSQNPELLGRRVKVHQLQLTFFQLALYRMNQELSNALFERMPIAEAEQQGSELIKIAKYSKPLLNTNTPLTVIQGGLLGTIPSFMISVSMFLSNICIPRGSLMLETVVCKETNVCFR